MVPVLWRVAALAYGLLCHSLFTAAIAVMFVAFHEGLQIGIGTSQGPLLWLYRELQDGARSPDDEPDS